MFNVFRMIPVGFFNNLASGSNQKVYADCLQLIYKEYEREISYRISKIQIRDALALYFLENHLELDEYNGDKNANDMANAVIRKFTTPDVGWLEEEIDDASYEKLIIMTENGIALAEFINQLEKPEQEEFSSYIYNIYNTLNNFEQWKENPYVNGIKNINKNARNLSKALKKLSTFIRKIIEKMVQEKSLESLTENILEYCEGSFIREYSRLTKQQNIHIYRMYIRTRLDEMKDNDELMTKMVVECSIEENISIEQAEDIVLDMIDATKLFLVEDYDGIMRDIKHKINVYLQIAIGRARFIRNRETDVRGSVETVIKYLVDELNNISMKEELPDNMSELFTMERHEFIDEGSIRYPHKNRVIKELSVAEIEELTKEDIQAAKRAQEKEAYNPYSRELMNNYIKQQMNEKGEVYSEKLPLNSKRDLLANLSAVAYAKENGFSVEVLNDYYETEDMILRRFKIVREEE